ncbi:MarR family winged helix-turn-helix transcriptional regulator [Streptococcus sp. H49]|uniref:MarR family winged helix-turn-helix transcriptional regulator n=1 Tax=Streptococcus huangxiaojuni TaxID=3237239 RepID=UPI0034A35E75
MTSTAQLFSNIYDKALIRYQNKQEGREKFPELTAREEHYLDILYGLGKTSPSDFSKKAKISRPAATKIIQSFLSKDYLIKTPSPSDGRVFYIQLTPEMETYRRQSFELADRVFLDILQILTKEEQDQLHQLFERVNKSLEGEEDDEPKKD